MRTVLSVSSEQNCRCLEQPLLTTAMARNSHGHLNRDNSG